MMQYRIKHELVFQNSTFWWIKAAHHMKFEEYFNNFYELLVQ